METSGVLTNASRTLDGKKMVLTFEVDTVDFSYLEEIQKMEKVSIKVTKFRKKRSLDANAYYWKLLTMLAEKIKVSKPRAHNYMLRKYGQCMYFDGQLVTTYIPDTIEAEEQALEQQMFHIKPTSQVLSASDGSLLRTYRVLKGSSDYDSKEMSELLDGLVSECKEQGIPTETPNEIEKMKALWGVKHG